MAKADVTCGSGCRLTMMGMGPGSQWLRTEWTSFSVMQGTGDSLISTISSPHLQDREQEVVGKPVSVVLGWSLLQGPLSPGPLDDT